MRTEFTATGGPKERAVMHLRKKWGLEVGTLGQHWYWGKKYPRLRLQVSVTVYRHVYPRSSDRWVIQPVVLYDRKQRSDERAD